jgi:hypothetical protein
MTSSHSESSRLCYYLQINFIFRGVLLQPIVPTVPSLIITAENSLTGCEGNLAFVELTFGTSASTILQKDIEDARLCLLDAYRAISGLLKSSAEESANRAVNIMFIAARRISEYETTKCGLEDWMNILSDALGYLQRNFEQLSSREVRSPDAINLWDANQIESAMKKCAEYISTSLQNMETVRYYAKRNEKGIAAFHLSTTLGLVESA